MIQLRQLALRQGGHLLFKAAQIQIHAGQKVGIIGANGCGKSSLFALIRGELNPDQGEIEIPAHWVIAHVAQQIPTDPIPILDYVLSGDEEWMRLEKAMQSAEGEYLAELHMRYEQINGYQARSRAAQLLYGLGFNAGDEQRLLTEFSGGWRMRLNLARALIRRSDLLLLDEPTNHLDLNAVIWLENWLQRYEGTLLLISHDREFLDRIVDHILHFEGQRLHWYKGHYSSFEKIRAAKLAQQAAAYQQQQKQIQQIQSYIQRFRAKASKAKQAQSRLKALQKMERIAPAHIDSPFRFHFFKPKKIPHPLLRLEKVSTGYDSPLLQNLNISLVPGDRIGLLGFNGAGKSTLIKLLAGELPALSGILERAPDLSIGYFAQHQLEQLQPEHSPLQHLLPLDPQADEQSLRSYLGRFGFSGDQAVEPIAFFSGGEKARLALALIIYQRPNLLLLDEPTNHLDLEMRQALVMALQSYEGAMVIVSHDRYLLQACTDQLWLVHQGEVRPFELSLEDYSTWLQAQQEGNKPRKSSTKHQQRRLAAQQRQRLQPLKKKLHQTEQDLDRIQQALADLDAKLSQPQNYQDPAQLKALMQQKKRLEAEAERLELAWLEAAETLEQAQQQINQ